MNLLDMLLGKQAQISEQPITFAPLQPITQQPQPVVQQNAPTLKQIMMNNDGSLMPQSDINKFYQNGQKGIYLTSNNHQEEKPNNLIPGVDVSQNDYVNMVKQGLAEPVVSTGLSATPEKPGILDDLLNGFQDNAQNSFKVSNLRPNENKSIANKVGEGVGTAARFLNSPTGRGLLMAGIVGATGGSGLQALTYGTQAGVTNQKLKTADSLYRSQLEDQGFDTSDISGYLNDDTYKNLQQYNYKYADLALKKELGTAKNKTQFANTIFNNWNRGVLKPEDAMKYLGEAGIDLDELQKSNSTQLREMAKELLPYKKQALQMAPQIAMGNLGVAQGNLGLRQAEFEFDKDNYGRVLPGKMPANSATDLSSTLQGINQMKTLEGQIGKLSPRLTTPGVAQLTALNPYDTDAQAFQQYVNTYKQIIGKGLEGGVLRKEDEIKYDKIIPKVGDTREVLAKKSDQLKGMLVNKYNLDLDALQKAGYYTGGFESQNGGASQGGGYTQVGKYKVRIKQ